MKFDEIEVILLGAWYDNAPPLYSRKIGNHWWRSLTEKYFS